MNASVLTGPTPGELIAHVLGDDCRHCPDGTNERGIHKGYDVAICNACGWIAVKEYGDE